MSPSTYYVWVRNDGYVAATTYRPHSSWNATFDIKLETTDWAIARDEIERLRSLDPPKSEIVST